jgi:hypothetical protein
MVGAWGMLVIPGDVGEAEFPRVIEDVIEPCMSIKTYHNVVYTVIGDVTHTT